LQDADLLRLRAHVTAAFSDAFNAGVTSYLAGDWPGARGSLERANCIMTEIQTKIFQDLAANGQATNGHGDKYEDGPSVVLLNYMADRNWTAPSDWKGFRPLTSK
jgi:hypothetical protein